MLSGNSNHRTKLPSKIELILGHIVSVSGQSAGRAAVRRFSGKTLSLPRLMHTQHPLSKLLGFDHAEKIARLCSEQGLLPCSIFVSETSYERYAFLLGEGQ